MDPRDQPAGGTVVSLSLIRNAQYDARLADIMRKRRGPLFLLVDAAGDLKYSSLPDSAPPAEHRLLGQAVAQAQILVSAPMDQGASPDDSLGAPNNPAALITLDSLVYSVRLIALHRATGKTDRDLRGALHAVIIEPIVGPLTDGVDFGKVRDQFRLSNRELDVLIALMTGTKDKQIARSLGVTTGTVRAYLKSVRAKLGVTTRTAIVNLVHEISAKGTPDSDA